MKLSKFSELVNRILSNNHSHRRDMDVTIVVHSPGRIGSTPSVEVQSIQAGFDWDAGQVMIFPSQPLTTLTPEQVADIADSVRKGQSWHAYQEYKKHKEQLEKLSMELEAAKQREKDLFMENVRLKSGIAGLIHLGIRYADVEVMKIAGDAQLSTPCTDSIINSIATWSLRLAMEKEFPDEEWRSADLRKILMGMAKDGTVSKDTYASRIGQAVWRLEVR
ncbi:hypothetical protein [Escherichia coli]|uniref:Ead/Ea22-like family protein n=1 Tax=Escherichia coli TaxID=562 RepID=A0A5B9ALB2_ECOLX|nr:hypothetical protein FTV93_10435 [Escherichia coli]